MRLKEQCPIVESTAPPGSVLHFTETMLHAGVPILSENVRYTMFYGFTPNWFVNWPGTEVAAYILKTVRMMSCAASWAEIRATPANTR